MNRLFFRGIATFRGGSNTIIAKTAQPSSKVVQPISENIYKIKQYQVSNWLDTKWNLSDAEDNINLHARDGWQVDKIVPYRGDNCHMLVLFKRK